MRPRRPRSCGNGCTTTRRSDHARFVAPPSPFRPGAGQCRHAPGARRERDRDHDPSARAGCRSGGDGRWRGRTGGRGLEGCRSRAGERSAAS
ncbi:MAG: hypothetical protein B7Z45_02770 [Azorhizobium sp. 12-66-6]|nr:MAG: hypothetical protein B7Z45_02770 [Azorhizobium sp. 12-66-6]